MTMKCPDPEDVDRLVRSLGDTIEKHFEGRTASGPERSLERLDALTYIVAAIIVEWEMRGVPMQEFFNKRLETCVGATRKVWEELGAQEFSPSNEIVH